MIYQEDKHIRLGGTLLPGLVQKIEVNTSARIEEAEVEGAPVKPKQAVGYEDAKIIIQLVVDDTEGEDALQKLERIQRLYRRSGAQKPSPLAITCQEAAAAGVSRVLFKECKAVRSNKTGSYTITLELWEYIPFTITATKSASSSSASASTGSNITNNYQSYLNVSRGAAPAGKTAKTPAKDTQPSSAWLDRHWGL